LATTIPSSDISATGSAGDPALQDFARAIIRARRCDSDLQNVFQWLLVLGGVAVVRRPALCQVLVKAQRSSLPGCSRVQMIFELLIVDLDLPSWESTPFTGLPGNFVVLSPIIARRTFCFSMVLQRRHSAGKDSSSLHQARYAVLMGGRTFQSRL